MPRHPRGDKAMTGAERQRQWRERKRKERGPATAKAEPSSRELAEARAEIDLLRAQLAAAPKAAPATDASRDPRRALGTPAPPAASTGRARDRTRPMLQAVRKFLPGRRPHVTQNGHSDAGTGPIACPFFSPPCHKVLAFG